MCTSITQANKTQELIESTSTHTLDSCLKSRMSSFLENNILSDVDMFFTFYSC